MSCYYKKTAFKLLYITVEYGKKVDGGIGRVVNGICSHFSDKRPFDVLLLKFNILRFDWDGIFFKGEKNFTQTAFHLNYQDTLFKLMAEEKYSLIHVFHAGIPLANCIRLVKKSFPHVKIIYSCHSMAKHEFKIRNNYPVDLDIEQYILENTDHIHLLNYLSLELLTRQYPLISARKPFSIIPNGINENHLYPINPNLQRTLIKKTGKPENIIVLCMSRWSHGKGLEYLLEAARLVIRERKNIRFIVAGRKMRSWENNFMEYVHKINKKIKTLKGYVFPMGWLKDLSRNTVMSIADIWVMPSLLEYFPYSILEPMAGGIPIIASKIAAVTEILTENEDGLFYNPVNPQELAAHILFLADHREKREQLSRNAHEKAAQNYHWNMITPRYLEMYHSVVNNNRESPVMMSLTSAHSKNTYL